jgi:hypothetical protein
MTTLLSDHNCEGQAERIRYSLQRLGYIEWLSIEITFFEAVDLPITSTDEEVWRFCQENGYYLLTGNRGTKTEMVSLHAVLNRLADEKSLPVITIGNLSRVIKDQIYCNACAEALAEIILNAELYIGTPRLYIP